MHLLNSPWSATNHRRYYYVTVIKEHNLMIMNKDGTAIISRSFME